jgi:hypothetical protein
MNHRCFKHDRHCTYSGRKQAAGGGGGRKWRADYSQSIIRQSSRPMNCLSYYNEFPLYVLATRLWITIVPRELRSVALLDRCLHMSPDFSLLADGLFAISVRGGHDRTVDIAQIHCLHYPIPEASRTRHPVSRYTSRCAFADHIHAMVLGGPTPCTHFPTTCGGPATANEHAGPLCCAHPGCSNCDSSRAHHTRSAMPCTDAPPARTLQNPSRPAKISTPPLRPQSRLSMLGETRMHARTQPRPAVFHLPHQSQPARPGAKQHDPLQTYRSVPRRGNID